MMRGSFSFCVLVALCGVALTVSWVAHSGSIFGARPWYLPMSGLASSGSYAPSLSSPGGVSLETQRYKLAFVTNGDGGYWRLVHGGVAKAEEELGVAVDFRMAARGTLDEQNETMAQLLNEGARGVTVAPANPDYERQLLDKASEQTTVFTATTDVPQSKRQCFLGTDSTIVSSQIANELRTALPGGGQVVVLAGLTDLQSALDQAASLKTELAESPLHVVDVYSNERSGTRHELADILSKHPGVDALVSLGGYSSGAILEALREKHLKGRVKVICTDASQVTFDSISQGTIAATIVPSPTELGYLSTVSMAKYLDGDHSVVPFGQQVFVPTQVVNKSNIDSIEG